MDIKEMMKTEMYEYVSIPSITYLNELLGKLIMGRASEEDRDLIRHYDAMVTEGVDTGTIFRPHRDLHHFATWASDVQTVLLKSENDGAQMYWLKQYNAECEAAREAHTREAHGCAPIT